MGRGTAALKLMGLARVTRKLKAVTGRAIGRNRRIAARQLPGAAARDGGKLAKGLAKGAGYVALGAAFGAFGGNINSLRDDLAAEREARGIGGTAGSGGSGSGASEALPPLKTPQTAQKISNPSLASMVDQIDQLVKIAKKISDNLVSQQSLLVSESQTAVRVSKERNIEGAANDNDAIPEPSVRQEGGDIGPVSSALDEFADAISALTEALSNGLNGNAGTTGGGTAGGGGGGLGGLGTAAVTGAGIAGIAAVAKRGIGRALPGLGRIGQASRNIGAAIATGGRVAARTGATSAGMRATIRRLARPIIMKGLGKTALKSIPLAGTVVGLGFAVDSLLKGDFVGAGLNAVSGLGGPITAIPAFLASVAREIYQGVYGVFPEQDPEFASRFPEILDAVKSTAAEIITPQVEMQGGEGPPSAAEAERMMPPTPPAQTQAPPTPDAIRAPPNRRETEESGGGSRVDRSAEPVRTHVGSPTELSDSLRPFESPASSAPAAGGAMPATPVSGSSRPALPSAGADRPAAPATPVPSPATSTGEILESAAIGPNEQPAGMQELSSFVPRAQPSMGAMTTRAGYTGQGNVPDPTYRNADALLPQLMFFG